jgi:ribosomal protein S18 acetylase RimI-like enzyme
MFLRSNLRAGGLVDRGEPYQATYAAAFEDGKVVAVAAHAWIDVLLVQAPVHLDAVVRSAVSASGRQVAGMNGPWQQVVAARAALGLADAPTRLLSREILYTVKLDDLAVPDALATSRVRCRRPRDEELALLAEWRVGYTRETMYRPDGPELRADSRREIEALHRERHDFVLVSDADAPLAFSAFNAALPDLVQVGGVWTPVASRGRGYARCVVAGSLIDARAHGVTRAILFTGEENHPAQRAYEALGFQAIGEYGLVGFAEPQPPRVDR